MYFEPDGNKKIMYNLNSVAIRIIILTYLNHKIT